MKNRNGLIAAAMANQADGYPEREAALLILEEKQNGSSPRITVGADKAYDTKDFVTAARALNVTTHLTKNEKGRRSHLDRRTTRHPGYAMNLSRRWLVEKGFGWLKQTGPLRQVKLRGLHKEIESSSSTAPLTTSCACRGSSPSEKRKAFSSSAPECGDHSSSLNRRDWSGSPTGAIAENVHNSGAGFGAGLYRNLVRLVAIRCGMP